MAYQSQQQSESGNFSMDTDSYVNLAVDIVYADMSKVAESTGSEWKTFSKHLFHYQSPSKTKAQVIDRFSTTRGEEDTQGICYDVLTKWKMECEHPTRENLLEALRKTGLMEIVKDLEEMWKNDLR